MMNRHGRRKPAPVMTTPPTPFTVAASAAARGVVRPETNEAPAPSEEMTGNAEIEEVSATTADVSSPAAEVTLGDGEEAPVAGEETPPASTPAPAGVWHSRHDVERAMTEVRQLLLAFAQRGVPISVDKPDAHIRLSTLRPRAQAFAACRILVERGICTQEDVQFEEAMVMRDLLSTIYQEFEERALEARKPVVARRGDLIVPGRQ